MKVKGSELGAVIRQIVKEELVKLLPTLISECLAERYLKKVVAEAVRPARAPNKLAEIMAGDREAETDWEEEKPEAMENDHQGIYHQSPLVRGKSSAQNESVRREMLAKVMGGMPSDLFDGIDTSNMIPGSKLAAGAGPQPAMMSESQQQFGEAGVPLEMLTKMAGTNFGKIKEAVEAPAPQAADETYEMKMRQLEMRRKALDVKA